MRELCAQINQSNMIDNFAVKDCTLYFNVDSFQVSDAEFFLRCPNRGLRHMTA